MPRFTKELVEEQIRAARSDAYHRGLQEGQKLAEKAKSMQIEERRAKMELIKALTQMISNQGQTTEAISHLVDNMGWN